MPLGVAPLQTGVNIEVTADRLGRITSAVSGMT
jgi:hypothetical protein